MLWGDVDIERDTSGETDGRYDKYNLPVVREVGVVQAMMGGA